MKLQIEHTINGYILQDSEGKKVFEEDENELKALQYLLYSVCESLGYFGSKHDAERLFIEIRKQKP